LIAGVVTFVDIAVGKYFMTKFRKDIVGFSVTVCPQQIEIKKKQFCDIAK